MNNTEIIQNNDIFLNNNSIYKEIEKKNKISENILTKYEKAKIIGIAAQQIENGRKPALDIPNSLVNPIDIAEYELIHKKTPFILKRKLPNNMFEYFKIEQLNIV